MKLVRIKQRIIYGTIVLVGLGLRTFRLTDVPGRLTIDEMSIGYNVFSLIQTGKDEWGTSWPMIFRAFGDYKLPAYLYGTLPFVWLGGINTISIRALSVLAGLTLIILVGLLIQKLTKNRVLGYVGAGVMAISPWPVFISRIALESNVGLMIFCTTIISLMTMFERKSKKAAFVTGMVCALSWYTYIAFRFITGAGIFFLLLLLLKNKEWRPYITRLVLGFCLCLLPLLPHIVDFSGQARFQQVSLFSDQGFVSEVNEDRSFCYLQNTSILPKICSMFFNKPFSWFTAFTSNYIQLFSPTFLFTRGSEFEHMSVPGFGMFMVVWLPFYLVGIWWWCCNNKLLYRLLGGLWLLSAIPSALAGNAHPVRASAVIPFVVVAIVFGLNVVWIQITQ